MEVIEPRFLNYPDKAIRFLEAEALLRIHFNKSWTLAEERMPKLHSYWLASCDEYSAKAKQEHKDLRLKVINGGFSDLEKFYAELGKLLKPKARGKALADKKKRTGQRAYQEERLGDAFIDNAPLMSAAKVAARELADQDATEEQVRQKAEVLAEIYAWQVRLTEKQQKTLESFLNNNVSKHLKLDRIEAKIIDQADKNLYFMYGQIKRNWVVGDTFVLGSDAASKLGKCSKSAVSKLLSTLTKLGFITRLQKGKRGSSTMRASLYRREA